MEDVILYNVYTIDYGYGDEMYEITTDDFDAWLNEWNKQRIKDGNEPEDASDFVVKEVYLKLYHSKNKELLK